MKMDNSPRLCPFRKISYAIDTQKSLDGRVLAIPMSEAYALDEDFKPCMQERCMAYRNGECGLCAANGGCGDV